MVGWRRVNGGGVYRTGWDGVPGDGLRARCWLRKGRVLWVRDVPRVSPHLGRHVRSGLDGVLLILLLDLGHVLLNHLERGARASPASDGSEDHGQEMRRHTGIHGLTEHFTLHSQLLEFDLLLTSLFLLLLPLVFLGPCSPVPIVTFFVASMRMLRGQRRIAEGLRGRMHERRSKLVGQGHGPRQRQATVGRTHNCVFPDLGQGCRKSIEGRQDR